MCVLMYAVISLEIMISRKRAGKKERKKKREKEKKMKPTKQ